MIENIKRFVKEHRTLIVVIIGVLVICYLYWWLFHKARTSTKEVGGKVTNYISARYILNERDEEKTLYFYVLGAYIHDTDRKRAIKGRQNRLLYVLNKEGERQARVGNSKILNMFVSYFNKFIGVMTEDNISLVNVVKIPCYFYGIKRGNSYNTAVAILGGKKKITKFIGSFSNFNFKEILEKYQSEEKCGRILEDYNNLCDFLDECASDMKRMCLGVL